MDHPAAGQTSRRRVEGFDQRLDGAGLGDGIQ